MKIHSIYSMDRLVDPDSIEHLGFDVNNVSGIVYRGYDNFSNHHEAYSFYFSSTQSNEFISVPAAPSSNSFFSLGIGFDVFSLDATALDNMFGFFDSASQTKIGVGFNGNQLCIAKTDSVGLTTIMATSTVDGVTYSPRLWLDLSIDYAASKVALHHKGVEIISASITTFPKPTDIYFNAIEGYRVANFIHTTEGIIGPSMIDVWGVAYQNMSQDEFQGSVRGNLSYYASSSNSGAKDIYAYNLDNYLGITEILFSEIPVTSIEAVSVDSIASSDLALQGALTLIAKLGPNEYEKSVSAKLTSTYPTNVTYIMQKNPDTNAPWTIPETQALETGYVLKV